MARTSRDVLMDPEDPTLAVASEIALRTNPLTMDLSVGPVADFYAEEAAFWFNRAARLPMDQGGTRSLVVIQVLPLLLLQKPGRGRGKGRGAQLLKRRIELWKGGDIQQLLKEATQAAERRLKQRLERPPKAAEDRSRLEWTKKIIDLVREGDIRKAANLVAEAGEMNGPAPWSSEVKEKLQKLHPD